MEGTLLQASLPLRSISKKASGELASPGNRHDNPMIAISALDIVTRYQEIKFKRFVQMVYYHEQYRLSEEYSELISEHSEVLYLW